MKTISIFSIWLILTSCLSNSSSNFETSSNAMQTKNRTYLALGDSYTIGEGVEEKDRYPNQLIQRLNIETPFSWDEAEIIAKTGWTVDELESGIQEAKPSGKPYDLVTLLIGVNNQYRGRSVDSFRTEFEKILLQAIDFAGSVSDHVVVLSIPDWGVTPFASSQGANPKKVADEIDAYNLAKESICKKHGVKFIDITEEYRQIGGEAEMLAEDQLHPSGKVYEKWTQKLTAHLLTVFTK